MHFARVLRSLSLRAYLLLLVLSVLLPMASLLVRTADNQRHLAAATAKLHALQIARIAVLEQSHLVATTRTLLASVSQLLVSHASEMRRCSPLLAGLLKTQRYYLNLGIIDASGRIICSAVPSAHPVMVADRSYFRRALKTGKFAVGNYQIGRITHKRAVIFAVPVTGMADSSPRVVFAAVDLSWIRRQITIMPLPHGLTVTLVDNQGTVLARAPSARNQVGQSIARSPLMQVLRHADRDGAVELAGADGVVKLYGIAPIRIGTGSKVYVIASIPRAIAFAAANRVFTRNLLLFIMVALAALSAAWIGADTLILRKTRAVSRAAQRLGQGDMTTRTGLGHDGSDFGQVAFALDDMAEKLQHHQNGIDATNRRMHQINRALVTLSSCNRTLVRAVDEQSLLEDMCRVIVETGGYRLAWVGYAQQDAGKSILLQAQAGLDLGYIKTIQTTWADTEYGRGPAGTVIRTGAPCLVQDILADARFGPWRQDALKRGYRATIGLPLTVHGQIMGALMIYAAEPDAFGNKEVDLLTELANDIAFGVETLRTRALSEKARETIWRMAYYDEVTGLPNHARLSEFLQDIMADVSGGIHSFALLLLDSDRFREINDAVGIGHANTLLREIAMRIRDALPEDELVVRMRGDDFAALLLDNDADHAAGTARRIIDIMQQPFIAGDLSLDVRVNIGIAQFPQHGSQVDQLLRRADLAVRRAKHSDSGYTFYQQGLDDDSPRRLALASDLRQALDSGLLLQYYQPQIDMQTGKLCGAEALARWNSQQYGVISPDEFIPLAEQTGLIRPFTYKAIETALMQLRAWVQIGCNIPVAVNLSARNLRDPELVHRIQELTDAYQIDCRQLELEITETAIMEDPSGALEVLTRLSAMGIALSIDDFGTGYSSLSYLNKLPVDTIKIDKSFVIDMLSNKDAATIVRSTIGLAHDLGLRVVAEGIESAESWKCLSELGCDVAQGYYIARPMPEHDLRKWMQEYCKTGVWTGYVKAA